MRYPFHILTLTALAAILAGCSSGEKAVDILDAIPVDANTIVITDFDRLRAEGVDFSNTETASRLAPIASGMAAFVTLNDGTTLGVLPAPPADSLTAAGFSSRNAQDGAMEQWADKDGLSVVVDRKKSIAYTIPLPLGRAAELAGTIEEATHKKAFSENRGLTEYVRKAAADDAAIFGVISQGVVAGQSGNPQGGKWLAFNVAGGNDEALIKASLLEGTGKPIEIEGMQTIDPDFLRYLPDGMNIVAAAGLTPEIDWDAAAAFLNLISDRSTASAIALIKPYLKSLDGTIAVALSSESPSIETMADIKIFAMAHLEPEQRQDIIEQIMRLALLSGVQGLDPTLDEKTNTMRLTIPADEPAYLYVGEVDGYLYIASWPVEPTAENSYTTAIEGHEAAAVVNVSADMLRGWRLPEGSTLNARFALDGPDATLRLAFPGLKESPLKVIFNAIP